MMASGFSNGALLVQCCRVTPWQQRKPADRIIVDGDSANEDPIFMEVPEPAGPRLDDYPQFIAEPMWVRKLQNDIEVSNDEPYKSLRRACQKRRKQEEWYRQHVASHLEATCIQKGFETPLFPNPERAWRKRAWEQAVCKFRKRAREILQDSTLTFAFRMGPDLSDKAAGV